MRYYDSYKSREWAEDEKKKPIVADEKKDEGEVEEDEGEIERESVPKLVERLRGGDESVMEELIERFAPRIRSIAKEIAGKVEGISEEDLVSEGYLGVMEAFSKMTEGNLSTVNIHSAIRRYTEDAMWGFVKKEGQENDLNRIELETGMLDVDAENVNKEAMMELGTGAERRLEETRDPLNRVLEEEERQKVQGVVRRLTPQRRKVVEGRYGFNEDGEVKTLQEIGDEMGVSRPWIREVERRAKLEARRLYRNPKSLSDTERAEEHRRMKEENEEIEARERAARAEERVIEKAARDKRVAEERAKREKIKAENREIRRKQMAEERAGIEQRKAETTERRMEKNRIEAEEKQVKTKTELEETLIKMKVDEIKRQEEFQKKLAEMEAELARMETNEEKINTVEDYGGEGEEKEG